MVIRRLRGLVARTLILSLVVVLLSVNPVAALSDNQSQVFDQGILYFDTEYGSSGCDTGGSISSTLPGTIPEPHKTLFTQAANAFKVNPQFIAALFLSENSNEWRPFNYQWGVSGPGAAGPFQFMPGTWSAYKTDGNNDGVEDINNMYDAAYSAANLLSKNGMKVDTPLGDINTPFKHGTFLYESAVYNWGGGNVQMNTNPTSPLSVAPQETQNYMKNVYALISSGFTKGDGGLGNPTVPSGGTGNGSTATGTQTGSTCSTGVVAGNIVQTALNFAWDTTGHGPEEADAKPTYQKAMPQYNGSTDAQPFSDCGVFVSTVMIASGADPHYPKRGTLVQIPYLKSHPSMYQEFDNVDNTSQLQPGDILINSAHTYLYTGHQSDGYDAVAASWTQHVPQPSPTYFVLNGEHFMVFRLIKQGG
jgi:hypothetical protein